MMQNWKDVVVSPETPLSIAIAKVDASGLQIALVLAPDDQLLGILTDGNIRRAILSGKGLEVPVSMVMSVNPTTVLTSTARDKMLALMRRTTFHQLPLIDDVGHVVGLVTLDGLLNSIEHPNWVVLMAGGLGTRLRPLTEERPKPMLAVGGKPILETILESFAEQGFKRIFLSVNYKAEMVVNHFGTGERWGVQLDYLHESTRLGTAGSLSLLPERPTAPIIVMNGDLLTHTNYGDFLQFHIDQGAAATMAVREHDIQVPYGVVRLDGDRIEAIEEKLVQRFLVNAGIYALSPDALDYLPSETFFDMPTLFERLIAAGKPTAAFRFREYWLDIGRIEEYERGQLEWGTDLPN
jgi:dTDP-glucose pyrophosphorylase